MKRTGGLCLARRVQLVAHGLAVNLADSRLRDGLNEDDAALAAIDELGAAVNRD